ncbi:MAG: NAD+ synthase [Pseudomonadota bacterium]|nr:NAD+ synthase [Pseudomonadales bacterium]MDY6921518.1 NAD+ synthase [Pseudomonadota bacterium]
MKNNGLHIIIAQLDFLVGDIDGNTTQILQAARRARDEFAADIIVFPELTLTGYPPEDLLFRASIRIRVEKALARLCRELPPELYTLVGYPRKVDDQLFNSAGLIHNGELQVEYHKQELPNYLVFDEMRYFKPGSLPCVVDIKGFKVGITICEDIWHPGPMSQARSAGAELMLNLNASPFHLGKEKVRAKLLAERAREGNMPIVYANLVGGQDELVFDGGSAVVTAGGDMVMRAPAFQADLYPVEFQRRAAVEPVPAQAVADQSMEASAYRALVLAVRDYVNKNGFKGAVLGLSGGVDSALTLAVAVDALGADRVEAVMMPFRYTSAMSLEDAEAEARALGVSYKIRPIEPMYEAFMSTLAEDFSGTQRDTTEENLQARCRGVILMALSNKKRFIVLTTGNKSEMAVGYATLYGDMAGGFDVLKDVPKTLVFRLCEYRNQLTPDNPPIPQRVIDRPPSAELAPDQKDEDSLPPYPELDAILEYYVEQDCSADTIVAKGYQRDVVERVIRLVDLNEYKRRQAPVGARITSRAFGRDRRYPITCKWPAGE